MTEERRSAPLHHGLRQFVIPAPHFVIPAQAGTQMWRATRANINDKKKAYPTIVIPAQAGIQQGRATPTAAKDWIPDRAADHLRDILSALAAARPG